jgi:hypothetical protein
VLVGCNNFSVANDSPKVNCGFAGEMQAGVLFSGHSVLKLRNKSTATNSKRDLQGQTEGWTDLKRKKLAIALGVICGTLMAITVLYALITAAFVEVNPVAAVAAISVAVAGIAWFRKASFHK